MEGSKQRKIGALLSYVSIILNNTISIIYTPFMLQMLGQSEYGLTGTASSYVSYLSLLSLGIGGAYIRYNAQYRAKNDKVGEERLNGMFLIVFIVLAFLVFVGGIIILFFSNSFLEGSFTTTEIKKLQLIMISMILNTIFTFLFTVVMMALQAYEKFIFLRICGLCTGIITPIVNIIILTNGGKSVSLSIATLIISLVCFIAYYIYAALKINFKFRFDYFDVNVLKDIITFSFFLFVNSLTDQLTFSTDNIILSKLFGTTSVAIYTVGSSFKNYFMSFSTSISSVFASKINLITAKNDDNEELVDIMIKVGRIQCIVTSLIIIGYASIGNKFVQLWAGVDYKDSFWIGLLLLLGIYIPCFQNVGLEIQKAKNKHKVRSVVYFFIALFNIIVSIPFAMIWGPIGAAFATFICLICGNVIFMNIYYQKGIGLNMKKFWLEIFKLYPGMIPSIIISILIHFYYPISNLFDILVCAIIISGIYLVGLWKVSLTNEEKKLLKIKI